MDFVSNTDLFGLQETGHQIPCLVRRTGTFDFIHFCRYMEFMEKSGELNDLKNYPQLKERCKAIGYEVSKVVFRGYYAAPKLQETHDSAIAARTRIKIEVSATFGPATAPMNIHSFPFRPDKSFCVSS